MHANTPNNPPTTSAAARRPWTKPELSCIPAKTAELGANPINPEGAFGQGS